MTARSLLIRVAISLGLFFAAVAALVMSINYQYFSAQTAYLEASKQTLLLSGKMEQVAQSIALGESASDLQDQLEMLATRSLPFDCCRTEYEIYLAVISEASASEWSNSANYRVSKASEEFLREFSKAYCFRWP